jgi:hypothetical protein
MFEHHGRISGFLCAFVSPVSNATGSLGALIPYHVLLTNINADKF